jgi:hypothetical protein
VPPLSLALPLPLPLPLSLPLPLALSPALLQPLSLLMPCHQPAVLPPLSLRSPVLPLHTCTRALAHT